MLEGEEEMKERKKRSRLASCPKGIARLTAFAASNDRVPSRDAVETRVSRC